MLCLRTHNSPCSRVDHRTVRSLSGQSCWTAAWQLRSFPNALDNRFRRLYAFAGEVETSVHVEPKSPVRVGVRPEQRCEPAPFVGADRVVEFGNFEDGLHQHRVDVAQGGLEQMQGEQGHLGVLAIGAGEVAVLAVEDVRVVNLYGPTEAAVDVTFHEFGVDVVIGVPIGVPVLNTRVYVLDGRCRSGSSVSCVSRRSATGSRLRIKGGPHRRAFVADPFGLAGNRPYRTGDIVRWSSGGELEYVGRSDNQIKLRGLRIELSEIEAALLGHDSVSQAAVLVRSDRLVAYVVPSTEAVVDTDALRAFASTTLPGTMVPAVFFGLPALPLGASGQVWSGKHCRTRSSSSQSSGNGNTRRTGGGRRVRGGTGRREA